MADLTLSITDLNTMVRDGCRCALANIAYTLGSDRAATTAQAATASDTVAQGSIRNTLTMRFENKLRAAIAAENVLAYTNIATLPGATEAGLDTIGATISTPRITDETDDDYRDRLVVASNPDQMPFRKAIGDLMDAALDDMLLDPALAQLVIDVSDEMGSS